MIVEVMGRHAGWIALHSGLAGGADVILIPERPFDIEEVVRLIRRRHSRGNTFSIVVVAEGAASNDGESVAAAGELDEFGHPRLGGQPFGDRLHVLEGDGADLAYGLRDDQVHVELAERRLVELVQGLPAARALAHRGVDLGRRQAVGDHAPREVRELLHAGRVVTLVGHGDDAVTEVEREEQLGRRRDE